MSEMNVGPGIGDLGGASVLVTGGASGIGETCATTVAVMGELSGKVAVVTGAGSGLGLGVATELARRGASVALLDVDGAAVTAAADQLGDAASAYAVDITDADALSSAVSGIVEHFGRIDIAVANAGIVGTGLVASIDPDRWERTIEVNVLGTFRTTKAVLPALIDSKGYLLITASGFAAAPGPFTSAYAASKAADESLGRSLRIELAHHGVGVGVAYYSFLDTPMVDAIEADPAAMRARAAMPAPIRKTYPLAGAVSATVDGIARRRDRVMYPKFLRWQLLFRGLFGPRSEGAWRKAMPEVEELEAR